ncbi:MAG: phosphoenolpyruvate--protein phosphotransferase, partial [Lachnospiraceae bacterium]|nr:phosphoenolpyruvate--protein phosphotransferase [Lachnospiraceae bacterium]
EEARRERLQRLKGLPAITKDGRQIAVYANIGSVEEVLNARENDAEGIGLFRSEFLYLEGKDFPSEEKQFAVYKAVLQAMEDKLVVIRTLDLGADKQADYLDLGHEENPAMGYRAIRICLDRPEIFRTQLRAIYRASVYGKTAILFPMIISLEEVLQCRRHIAEVKAELKQEGIPYKDDVQIGVMIETPAAALISETLAKEVDFFSIGTNDLAQYTLAIDRQNAKMEAQTDMRHPAVQELIRMTIANGHKAGIRVEICGELAADTSFTQTFLDYGVDALSVSPPFVLPVKDAVIQAE